MRVDKQELVIVDCLTNLVASRYHAYCTLLTNFLFFFRMAMDFDMERNKAKKTIDELEDALRTLKKQKAELEEKVTVTMVRNFIALVPRVIAWLLFDAILIMLGYNWFSLTLLHCTKLRVHKRIQNVVHLNIFFLSHLRLAHLEGSLNFKA